jgi:hypothetical protein
MQTLQLERWPVVSVTSVTENGTVLVSGTDFSIDKVRGRLLRLDGCGQIVPWSSFPLVVQYQGGYSAIPADLAMACIRLVLLRYKQRNRDPMLMEESTGTSGTRRWWVNGGLFPQEIKDVLGNYTVPAFG